MFTIRGIPRTLPGDHREVLPPPWLRVFVMARLERTPPDQFANPPHCAESSALSRPTDVSAFVA